VVTGRLVTELTGVIGDTACYPQGFGVSIKPQVLREGKIARLLATTLDPGEAEAIALALELSADLILLDGRDGRKDAEHAGLRVTGALGVLLRAKNDGRNR
jgi:predicted nucleic acid-binding protein